MTAHLTWTGQGLHFLARAESGHTLSFDSPAEVGGTDQAARPMEGLLTSMVACFSADVVSILQKKRKTVQSFQVRVQAERQAEFPRVFTEVSLHLVVESPDAAPADLERSIELSRTKYCAALAMFEAAGCRVHITYDLNPSRT
ncbi:MAG: osmotically inducible protein OsmC [Bacteroidetes bacterium]|nr:MAG: osmotically inducible protein OsmC [Bacteroidota bacterium]